jgi:preprotein translocase subunit SecA
MLKNPFKNKSLLNQYQNLINQINILETDLKTLTDSELRAKSFKIKKTLSRRAKFKFINSCNHLH